MEKLARVQLATTLPGPKPICLVGTRSARGESNLAPFSSVTHLGSSPLLIGMVSRPDTVERHTLSNILETKEWTLNHLTPGIMEAAHQTSARYPREKSEFDATNLTEHFHPGVHPPFVQESPISYALKLVDLIEIPANNTRLIVGEVTHIELPDGRLEADGRIDLEALDILSSTGLDTYFSVKEIARLPYARP
ncbi:MAG: flavin reductase family protein [Akkermansiaceae bacterium]